MSKDHKILPKLRFPEFESDGEFREKSLGYFCDYWNGSGNESGVTEDGQYLLISLNSIDIEGNLKSDMKRVPSTDNSLKKGDLVMVLSDVAHGNFLGLSAIIPDDNYVLNQRMAGLGIKDFSEIDPKYLRLFINGNQKYFKRQGQGSSQQNLSKGSVIDFPVLVPTRLIEQQKIASCLSSLDELIAAHKDKLDALKDHKKGLLQNLFPQEGETVPKVRFPEFEEDGEWELKPFSKFIKLYRGSSPRPIREYLTKEETGVNWIKIGDTSSITDFVIRSVSEKITPKGAEKSRRVKKGELILANSMSYGSTYLLEVEGCIYDGWFVLREYEEHFDKQFLLQLLNSEYTQGQYKRFAAGGIVQNISSEIVYSITLSKTSKEEQQKIASCLSSLDEAIEAQAEKIEQLKMHKKGLMQGLFPSAV
jgi:type I restriction enzyme S subunit